MLKTLKILIAAALVALVVTGCSETKNATPPVEPSMTVHGIGFADKNSSNFHATYLRTKNDDLTLCQSCHGADYKGGTTNQSCVTCHTKTGGPENCTTCHGSVNAAPPKDLSGNTAMTARGVGMHQKHLGAAIGADVACSECHSVPKSVFAAGHLDGIAGAEVKFDSTSDTYRSGVVYDKTNGTCANTYCHGNRSGGNAVTMTWTDTSSTAAACGTCHGKTSGTTLKEKAFPLTGHTAATVTSDCATCHVAVVNSDLSFKNKSLHINGFIN